MSYCCIPGGTGSPKVQEAQQPSSSSTWKKGELTTIMVSSLYLVSPDQSKHSSHFNPAHELGCQLFPLDHVPFLNRVVTNDIFKDFIFLFIAIEENKIN